MLLQYTCSRLAPADNIGQALLSCVLAEDFVHVHQPY